jgi:methylaspartate mutase epsilon subunit
LTHELLEQFGFGDVRAFLVYHQWMGQFPSQREKAAALIAGSSIVASMVRADKVVVKTVDEALGVPTAEVNAEAVETVRYVLRIFDCVEPITSPLMEREARLIETEARCILDAVFRIPGNVFWESVFRAFQLGYLDVPFAPHADNSNRLVSMRDANGSIRIADRGAVPISDLDAAHERQLLMSGAERESRTYRQLLRDINLMMV